MYNHFCSSFLCWDISLKGYLTTVFIGSSENLKTSLRSRTTVSPGFAGTFGMIQQERQNNIINILGGHSYAM